MIEYSKEIVKVYQYLGLIEIPEDLQKQMFQQEDLNKNDVARIRNVYKVISDLESEKCSEVLRKITIKLHNDKFKFENSNRHIYCGEIYTLYFLTDFVDILDLHSFFKENTSVAAPKETIKLKRTDIKQQEVYIAFQELEEKPVSDLVNLIKKSGKWKSMKPRNKVIN